MCSYLNESSSHSYFYTCWETKTEKGKHFCLFLSLSFPFSSSSLLSTCSIPPWRWRQYGPPKLWNPTASLHCVTTQKTSTWLYIAMKTSNFISGEVLLLIYSLAAEKLKWEMWSLLSVLLKYTFHDLFSRDTFIFTFHICESVLCFDINNWRCTYTTGS